MRSSIILGAFCASLAMAYPFERLAKKFLVTDIETKIVWVTVTEGESMPQTSAPAAVVVTRTTSVAPVPTTSTSLYVAHPAPSSSTPAPVVVVESTSEAPAVHAVAVATTSSAAPVVEETSAAAVVPVASSTTAAAAVASPTDYQSTAIYHHAKHRANHSAPALTWSDDLASSALTLANTCVFAHDMTIDGGGYSQNLAAYGSSGDVNSFDKASLVADAITNQWYYGEAANVPYGVASPSTSGPDFLHFTALVWKESSTVGCATVACDAGTIFSLASLYTVCNYESEGNILGDFVSNVLEPLDLPPITATIES